MSQFRLYRGDEGLCLVDQYSSQKPLRIDFAEPKFLQRLKQAGRRSELIARAVKPRPDMRVLDCTAGLARESFLLAHLGCHVTLIERSKVIGELIRDGLTRASMYPFLAPTVSRMQLVIGDASRYLSHLQAVSTSENRVDVIYIDPMFPQKSGSAAVGGEMQMLQRFLGVDEDARKLLELALSQDVSRVVLKRPPHGDWHPPVKPVHVFSGKNSRYELFGA